MKEIKLGTIGSGFIVRSILDNVMCTPGISLEAVYSRSQERGNQLAGEYGCGKVYTDMDAFLADDNVNVVYIAIPNLLHYEQAKKALLAGKHVLLEKPFTSKVEHARELAQIAKEKGLFLLQTAPTSYLPNLTILRRELPKIGKIKLVMSNFSQYSSRYDAVLRGEKPAIFDPAFAGGCLMDINFYNVLLNILLFGKPEKATYYPNFYPGLGDTSGVMLMNYDGFISTNAAAKDASGVNFFQIEGEKGYIYVADGGNCLKSLRTVTKDSDETYNEQPVSNCWFYEIQEVTRILLEEDWDCAMTHMEQTIQTIETIETARKEAGIFFPGD